MATEPKLCRSGSGALALRGTFAPGGDAKYKSQLINRAIAGPLSKEEKEVETKRLQGLGYDEEHLRDHATELMTVKRAEAVLEERGWTKFLDKKRETIAAHEAKKAAKAEERAAKVAAAKEAKAKAKAEAAA